MDVPWIADLGAGGGFDQTRMWDRLSPRTRMAATGLELPTPSRASSGTRRAGHRAVEAQALAGDKKQAQKQGFVIVFVDESGLSQRPHRCRTWAPRGQTPVLQYHFNWKSLSAMAGVTWWNFYFRLFRGSIRSPQVVQFLEHLLRHLDCKLLVVWDGSRSHRSRLVWDFVREQKGRLWLEFLFADAPELNPVEVFLVPLETTRAAQSLSAELLAATSEVLRVRTEL
jgi:hypothetical protein